MGRQYLQNRNHLESLATIYSVKKERSSQIREKLSTICDGIDTDIITVSQSFEVLASILLVNITLIFLTRKETLSSTL